MNKDDLQHRFTFHPAAPDQAPRYEAIRAKALELAEFVDDVAPDGREKSLAVTHLEEAVFWANAAIARGEPHHGGHAAIVVTELEDATRGSATDETPKADAVDDGERRVDVEQDNAPAADVEDSTTSTDETDELEPAADVRPCTSCNGAGCPVCRYSGRAPQ